MKNFKSNNVYFIIQLGDFRHYIMKSNVLRFHTAPSSRVDAAYYLGFTMKGGEKIGFHITGDWLRFFERGLPHPAMIEAIDLDNEFSDDTVHSTSDAATE